MPQAYGRGYRSLVMLVLIIAVVGVACSASARTTLQVYLAETTGPYVNHIKEITIPAFEARYPDIKVELQLGNWGVETVSVRYAGGAAPDVIQLGSGIASYEGMLLNLNPFTEGWRRDLNDFPPGAIEAVTVNGEIQAIPFALTTRTLTYRKDFFSQSGLDPERPPTTWDELVACGKRLVRFDPDGSMTRQGFRTSNHYHDFAAFLFQAGGNYMSDDLKTITFADDAGMEAAAFMNDLFHVIRITDKDAGDFKKGGAAMEYLSPSYISPEYESQTGIPNEDIGVAMPLKHKRQSQILLPNSWAIINTTSYPDEAWNWVTFASSLESVIGIGRATGIAPPRRSVINYPPWSTDVRWKTTYEAISIAMSCPIKSPHFPDIRKTFVQPGLSRILYDQEPLSVWKDVQRQAQVWLDGKLGR